MSTYLKTVTPGGVNTFSVPEGPIEQDHIIVTVNGTTTPYTWVDATNVSIDPPPEAGALVARERITPTAKIVSYQTDFGITEQDLEIAYAHSLNVAEEAKGVADRGIIETTDRTALTARQRRIRGVVTPAEPADAANKFYVDSEFISQLAPYSQRNATEFLSNKTMGFTVFTGDIQVGGLVDGRTVSQDGGRVDHYWNRKDAIATLTGTQTFTNKSFGLTNFLGNINVVGLVDGRNVSQDGSKLDELYAAFPENLTLSEMTTAINGVYEQIERPLLFRSDYTPEVSFATNNSAVFTVDGPAVGTWEQVQTGVSVGFYIDTVTITAPGTPPSGRLRVSLPVSASSIDGTQSVIPLRFKPRGIRFNRWATNWRWQVVPGESYCELAYDTAFPVARLRVYNTTQLFVVGEWLTLAGGAAIGRVEMVETEGFPNSENAIIDQYLYVSGYPGSHAGNSDISGSAGGDGVVTGDAVGVATGSTAFVTAADIELGTPLIIQGGREGIVR